MNNLINQKYISLKEAADRLGLNKVTLEKAAEQGELIVVKDLFRYTATTEEWLEAFVQKKTVNLPAEQGE